MSISETGLYAARSARFVNRADDCTGDGEHKEVASDPAAQDFRRYRLDRIGNEVVSSINERHQQAEACAASGAARGISSAEHRQKERHHDVAEDQPREIVTEVCFGPPKHWHFIVHAVQKLPVPDEAKGKHKNERCDECNEEFFPVHNF